jgi:integrase
MRSGFKDESDLMFPNTAGGPLDGHNMVSRPFRPTLKKAGLPTIRFHDLRHTAATLAAERGCAGDGRLEDARIDTYSHVLPDSLDEASNAMETAIFGTRLAVAGQT